MPAEQTMTVTVVDESTRVVVQESPTEVTVQEVSQAVTVGAPGPKGRDGEGVAYYGQISNQTEQTVTIQTAGVYVPMAINGVLDSAASYGLIESTDNQFGLRNNTDRNLLFFVIATADVSLTNNRLVAIRLAKNGVDIAATTCSAATGNQNIAKLLSQWMIRLDIGDEVSCFLADISSAAPITVIRSKIVAFSLVGTDEV